MRVAGYIRESADPSAGRSAFAQQEEIRRFADEHGHLLVVVCQDLRRPGHPTGRDGYVGLIGAVASGSVDAVVVPDLDTFSADTIVQEIVLWDLQRRGARVISARDEDAGTLEPEAGADPSRLLIRDVLDRVDEHAIGIDGAHAVVAPQVGVRPDGDVYVRLIESDATEAAATR